MPSSSWTESSLQSLRKAPFGKRFRPLRLHKCSAASVFGRPRSVTVAVFRCGRFCREGAPCCAAQAFTMASMTALQKWRPRRVGGGRTGRFPHASASQFGDSYLLAAKAVTQPGEQLFAFLDDVYTLSSPSRTRSLYNMLEKKLVLAGIWLHTGKIRSWNYNNTCPVDMPELRPEVWSPQGVEVLGTPIGTPMFVEEVTQKRF